MENAVIDIRSSGQRNSDMPSRAAALTAQVVDVVYVVAHRFDKAYRDGYSAWKCLLCKLRVGALLGFTTVFLFPYQRSSRVYFLTALSLSKHIFILSTVRFWGWTEINEEKDLEELRQRARQATAARTFNGQLQFCTLFVSMLQLTSTPRLLFPQFYPPSASLATSSSN